VKSYDAQAREELKPFQALNVIASALERIAMALESLDRKYPTFFINTTPAPTIPLAPSWPSNPAIYQTPNTAGAGPTTFKVGSGG
jgi:hypothetical protein